MFSKIVFGFNKESNFCLEFPGIIKIRLLVTKGSCYFVGTRKHFNFAKKIFAGYIFLF